VLDKNKIGKLALFLDGAFFILSMNGKIKDVRVIQIPVQFVQFPVYVLKLQWTGAKSQSLSSSKEQIQAVKLNKSRHNYSGNS
jgi:hypothetical protein